MKILLLLLPLLLLSCSKKSAADGSLIRSQKERIASINTLSDSNRDSLMGIIARMETEWDSIKTIQISLYEDFIELDREYDVETDSLRALISVPYQQYLERSRSILKLRYSMRSFMNEQEWYFFTTGKKMNEETTR